MDDTGKAAAKAGAGKRSYNDLQEHIAALDKAGLLTTIDAPINKDTEMHPLVRWQFRGGIPEPERKAFLFTNVTDSRGRKYDIPVLVGGLAANPEIYRIGMGAETLAEIGPKWDYGLGHPVQPTVVTKAPCQEVVLTGADIQGEGKGLDALPIPISTPGFDVAPYFTAATWITKDPDDGIQNMGVYRGNLKAPDRVAVMMLMSLSAGGYYHWKKYQARGERMPVAIILGCPPVVDIHRAAEGQDGRRRALGRGRTRRWPDQRGQGEDGRPAGAGRGADRHRRADRPRVSRAGRAVRRIARLRRAGGIQLRHGRDGDHAPQSADHQLDHLASDAESSPASSSGSPTSRCSSATCATRSASRA